MTTPGSHTIGVAIAIPEPYATDLRTWRDNFGDPLARSIPTHITLLPPTPVTDGALPAIEEHLEKVARAERPFEIVLRGTGSFRPVSPVVFVALARGTGHCERVERNVRQGPLNRTLSFPYHPHVTVAHDLSDDVLDWAFDQLAGYDARFVPWGFGLFEHGADGVWRLRRAFPFRVQVPAPRSYVPVLAAREWSETS
ncbi:MAG: 2'-5' RNA ligase family protein [Streptosporangiaceae bacterium]